MPLSFDWAMFFSLTSSFAASGQAPTASHIQLIVANQNQVTKMGQHQTDDDAVQFARSSCANQNLSCQLLVVGGGLSGLSAAEAALTRGVDVVLIEKGAFGQEAASALNAGEFLCGWAKSVDVMLDGAAAIDITLVIPPSFLAVLSDVFRLFLVDVGEFVARSGLGVQ